MKTIELNIGLSGNPLGYAPDLVARGLSNSLEFIGDRQEKVIEGQYKGQPEQALIVLGKTNLDEAEIQEAVRLLAHRFNQECIAYTLDGRGELVYVIGHSGEQEEFNYAFFNTLQVFGKDTRTGGLQNTGVCKPINEDFNN